MTRQELNKQGVSPQLSPTRAKRTGAVRSNALLIAVFAAGVTCVYLLGLREPPRMASGEQRQAEPLIDPGSRTSGKSDSADLKPGKGMAVVNTFYYQAKQRQIPAESLLGNPFVNRSPRIAVPAPTKAEPKVDHTMSQSFKEAMEQVKKLRLESVLMGPDQSLAVISGQLLTEGQKVRGWTVGRIESGRVVLTWRDQKFVLEISQ